MSAVRWSKALSRSAQSLLIGNLVLLPSVLAAQSIDVPRVSIGVGAGFARPFHGDFDFTPWAWDADARFTLSRHVQVEVAVSEWRHAETRVAVNIPVTPPPGLIGRLETTTARRQRIVGGSLLFTGAARRIRFSAGGGVGVLQHVRQTYQVTEQCSPNVSCGPFASTFRAGTGMVQAVGGADIALNGGFAIYGQTRFIVPPRDPGSSDLRITTGIRWGLRPRT